jgi:Pvc16 N-terminal domain
MANFKCISAAGKTIERVLNAAFTAEQPIDGAHPTKAVLVRSDDFARENGGAGDLPARALAVFLYRVDVSGVMRAAWSGVASYDGQVHLPLDLHFLLIAFADNAEWEQAILGKTLQTLEATPSLGGPMLYPTADWTPGETVHLVVEDVPLDSLMRTFDSLAVDYRPCIAYLARIVRLDGANIETPPTTSTVITGATPVGV